MFEQNDFLRSGLLSYPHDCGFFYLPQQALIFMHGRVALFKHDFLKDPCTESWTSCAQMKAENLRNPNMSLHAPTAASKLEL